MSQLKSQSFIFIVTYGRSGSTLLQAILQSIDGYFIRGENNNALLPLFRTVSRITNAKAEHRAKSPEGLLPNRPWYGIDQVKPEKYAERLVSAFVDEILQPPEGKRVLGFKEIRFHEAKGDEFERYLNFINTYMGPAKFIFNRRNWQDVARSGWWRNCDEAMVKDLVLGADAQYAGYSEKYPERCYTVQYEDYKDNPEYWRDMFVFLNEPFDLDKIKSIQEELLLH